MKEKRDEIVNVDLSQSSIVANILLRSDKPRLKPSEISKQAVVRQVPKHPRGVGKDKLAAASSGAANDNTKHPASEPVCSGYFKPPLPVSDSVLEAAFTDGKATSLEKLQRRRRRLANIAHKKSSILPTTAKGSAKIVWGAPAAVPGVDKTSSKFPQTESLSELMNTDDFIFRQAHSAV